MTEFFDSARVLVHGDLPRILFDAAVKGAVILILSTVIDFALRRASASLRHLLWSLSIAALVALPLLTALAPQWSVPGLPTLAPAASIPSAGSNASPVASESPVRKVPFAAPPEERDERRPSAKPTPDVSFVSRSLQRHTAGEQAENDAPATAATPDAESTELAAARSAVQSSTPASAKSVPERTDFALPWTAWAAILWATVASVVLSGIALGVLRTWLIGRKARRLSSGALVHLADELSARLGLRKRVSLLQSTDFCVPLTWGVIRPRILLPADAIAWPTARLRAVLLHELAHVKRFDYLTHLLARFACAVHWFNPLVWHAANKVREESELACDDQVLRSGSLPSEYAGHLLELARSLKAEPMTSLATVAIIRPSQLSQRLRAVLDDRRARSKLSWRAKVPAWLCAGLIAIPIAGASPGVGQPPAIEPEDASTLPAEGSAKEQVRPDLIWLSGQAPEPRLNPETSAGTGPVRFAEFSTPQLLDCDWFAKSGKSSSSVSIDDDRMRVDMRRGDCVLSVDLDGEITFDASFTEIASLSRGGQLEIEEERGRESRRLILEEDGGQLIREWYVNRDERPYDSDARTWLSKVLLVLFRRAGLQATERAEYILEQDGVDGLLSEISQIPSDYTARKYYTVLLTQAELEPEQVRQIVSQAGQEIDSDYELGEMLIAIAENQPLDESVRIAYVEAAGSIDSDYEHRRVLSAILTREDLSSELAQAMLVSATDIASDYELAELLIELLQHRPLDDAMTGAFFEAVGSLDSDFETRRVLEAALQAGAPSRNALDRTLQAAAGIDSDHELGQLLVRVADLYPMDSQLPESYVTAARSIDSSFELSRVLTTLLARGDLAPTTLGSILDIAAGIESDYELAQVLTAFSRDYAIGDPVRPAFFQAANAVTSDFERRGVLATVLREQELTDPLVEAVLESAVEIDSDFELSTLLLELLDRYPVGTSLRPAFDRAVETIDSEYERDRVRSAAYSQQSARI